MRPHYATWAGAGLTASFLEPLIIKDISSGWPFISIDGEDFSNQTNCIITQGNCHFGWNFIVCSHNFLVEFFISRSSVRETSTQ